MSFVAVDAQPGLAGVSRPMVKGLFAASCMLSVVSWYTTQQGMALYLSGWFALLASFGVQSALVLVAWLIGFTKSRRALLVAVYVVTAAVSVAFSYVSLYTWFSARERPAAIERRLYDSLNDAAGKVQALLTSGIAEGRKHVLGLQEMTQAEKEHGYISRAEDADPYLAQIREAVAREARTYSESYREGAGTGLRYTAFDRYTKMTEQAVARIEQAQRAMADFQSHLKPQDPTDKQLRQFRQAYDSIPWDELEQQSHSARLERPAVPNYADFVDRSSGGQEDLLIAFQELFTAPTGRHVFAFALAAFIDVIVFLLAYASGPFFFGAAEQRWLAAGAALDGLDTQVFVRSFLSKLNPSLRGMARVEAATLSPGEKQLCLLFTAKGLATVSDEEGSLAYLIDEGMHENMMELLASQGFTLRASARRPAMSQP